MVSTICCIGAGYVGATTGAIIAYKNPSIQVTILDVSQALIDSWNSDNIPIYEPGLQGIVQKVKSVPEPPRSVQEATCQNNESTHNRNLTFSTQIDNGIRSAELIFICVDTPTRITGPGAGLATDLRSYESAVAKILEVAVTDKIIVEKSTVPCGTAAHLRDVVSKKQRNGVTMEILSNPEFLVEGNAIANLLNPDRIIIGSENTTAGVRAMQELVTLYSAWIPQSRIIVMDLWSSELAKLAANAMLAQRISSINSLSAICELVGADIHQVKRACASDFRIGSQMLEPSIGFGGSCFEKDIKNLVYLAKGLGLEVVADYWLSVLRINEHQKSRQSKRILEFLPSKNYRQIAILGFSFKKDTGDIRGTPVLRLVKDLVHEGFQINIFDPQASAQKIQEILDCEARHTGQDMTVVRVLPSALQACKNVHAVVVATAWDIFRTNPESCIKDGRIDWGTIARDLRQPKVVFDCCNVVEGNHARHLGFNLVELGKTRALL